MLNSLNGYWISSISQLKQNVTFPVDPLQRHRHFKGKDISNEVFSEIARPFEKTIREGSEKEAGTQWS